MPKFLKPIKESEQQILMVAKKINQYFDEMIFNYLQELFPNRLANSTDLIGAINAGTIIYDGRFLIAPEGKIKSDIAKQIEDFGGKYSKAKKGYRIDLNNLPAPIQQSISLAKSRNIENIKKAKDYLLDLEKQIDFIFQKFDFTKEAKIIGMGVEASIQRQLNAIHVIAPEMTDYQMDNISKNYTESLKIPIKNFAEKETIKLRQELEKMILNGSSQRTVAKYIQSQKNVSRNKAEFLARNETGLLIAEYQKNRYTQAGISKYKWSTILDGRERLDHKELNGRIFFFNDPPIIDKATGRKGNPREDYNCRCKAIPIVD